MMFFTLIVLHLNNMLWEIIKIVSLHEHSSHIFILALIPIHANKKNGLHDKNDSGDCYTCYKPADQGSQCNAFSPPQLKPAITAFLASRRQQKQVVNLTLTPHHCNHQFIAVCQTLLKLLATVKGQKLRRVRLQTLHPQTGMYYRKL